jgi:hypothetical protein
MAAEGVDVVQPGVSAQVQAQADQSLSSGEADLVVGKEGRVRPNNMSVESK